MAEEQAQEKTERATPRREKQAREEGSVVRSRELGTMGLLLAAAGGVLFMGESAIQRLAEVMRQGFQLSRTQVFDPNSMPNAFAAAVLEGLKVVAPFLGLFVVVALFASIAVGGLTFSIKAIGFKWERLDPVEGLGKIFAWRGFIELAKSIVKFAVVGAVALWWLRDHVNELLSLADESLETGMAHAAHLLAWSFVMVSAGTILIALVDVPVQLWQHHRQMRMSRQELRDELKETEGKPELRARIRRMQREMASRRMMQEVPKADVIVTNPTHYAVALKYDATRMRAPRVVAKGADLVALTIRRLGEAHGVMRFSAPPLARALYHSTEINREIPQGLYRAVAQVLAYVYQLRQPRPSGVGEPIPPSDFSIPDDLRRDS